MLLREGQQTDHDLILEARHTNHDVATHKRDFHKSLLAVDELRVGLCNLGGAHKAGSNNNNDDNNNQHIDTTHLTTTTDTHTTNQQTTHHLPTHHPTTTSQLQSMFDHRATMSESLWLSCLNSSAVIFVFAACHLSNTAFTSLATLAPMTNISKPAKSLLPSLVSVQLRNCSLTPHQSLSL